MQCPGLQEAKGLSYSVPPFGAGIGKSVMVAAILMRAELPNYLTLRALFQAWQSLGWWLRGGRVELE